MLSSRCIARVLRPPRHPSPCPRRPNPLNSSRPRCRSLASVAAPPPIVPAAESPPPEGEGSRLSVPSTARHNVLGVQQLPSYIHNQIFFSEPPPPPDDLVDLAKKHLDRHELLGKTSDSSPPIAFDLPPLHGKTLDEHFTRLGREASEPYITYAKVFAVKDLPLRPRKWVHASGWTKYCHDGHTEAVDSPVGEEMLVFDVEVLYKQSPFAVMACAASPTAWYTWLSPWLLGESESDRHLVPLGDPTQPRIVVGHNIGYDRARIAEEYNVKQTRNSFLDTMSLHVAVNGMCSRQRPTWMKHAKNRELREKVAAETDSIELANLLEYSGLQEQEEELWINRSSINSLRDVAKFHCDVTIDKAVRDQFGLLDRAGVVERLDDLLEYCAADVAISHKVYKIILPRFLETCPHPVSFSALRHLSSVTLPVNRSWESYIANAEATYHRMSDGVQERLFGLAKKALEVRQDPTVYNNDPWLQQLDWSGQEIKMCKGKKKGDPPRPVARQKLPGMPKWYKALYPSTSGPINLSVRSRIAPILLRLSWQGHPLIWSEKHGWTFRVDYKEAAKYQTSPAVRCDMREEPNLALRDDTFHVYFKLPHKDGPTARCVSPLAKSYLSYFESGTLTSEYELAKEALEMNAACSYWISARERIMSQMVVYASDLPSEKPLGLKPASSSELEPGLILPQLIPMGTITRRAVEATWLTASNAKKNRVGSELKAMVKAPPGYVFVGADVDSQELWIASLVGDAQFGLHGGNAIGFMTLEGTKAAGTDLHSKTASILGISRNDAKVFNYGRIYGAGLKFASTLLRKFNPNLSDAEAADTAQKLYAATKGTKATRKLLSPRPFWRGGTESFVFNALEEFADQDKPRTPVLGAGLTEALMRRYLSRGGFLTSRINWAIQSSGVDYLHLLIIGTAHLIHRHGLDARLAITVHDEIRYLVKEEHRYRLALALQIANLWTRAMFAQQMGIQDLPQSVAWFSAVDIDKVLRKEVDLNCVTPSHPDPIPPGESLDITQLLAKGPQAALGPVVNDVDLGKWEYTPRVPVLESLRTTTAATAISDSQSTLDATLLTSVDDVAATAAAANAANAAHRVRAFMKAQIAEDETELKAVVREYREACRSTTTTTTILSPDEKKRRYPGSWQPQPISLPVGSPPWKKASAAGADSVYSDSRTRSLTRGRSEWNPSPPSSSSSSSSSSPPRPARAERSVAAVVEKSPAVRAAARIGRPAPAAARVERPAAAPAPAVRRVSGSKEAKGGEKKGSASSREVWVV